MKTANSLTNAEIIELADNMRRYGGNFISRLADALVAGDPINRQKILDCFPEVVERYKNIRF